MEEECLAHANRPLVPTRFPPFAHNAHRSYPLCDLESNLERERERERETEGSRDDDVDDDGDDGP